MRYATAAASATCRNQRAPRVPTRSQAARWRRQGWSGGVECVFQRAGDIEEEVHRKPEMGNTPPPPLGNGFSKCGDSNPTPQPGMGFGLDLGFGVFEGARLECCIKIIRYNTSNSVVLK